MVDYARRDRRVRLEDAIEGIRSRFGKQALTYAVLMGDLKMPNDGRDVVRMPGLMYQWGVIHALSIKMGFRAVGPARLLGISKVTGRKGKSSAD